MNVMLWLLGFQRSLMKNSFYIDIFGLSMAFFKKAVFKYAARYNKPVIPMAFSFRPRKGIYKLFGNNPLVDLNVGEPLYPDATLSIPEATEKLHQEAYHAVQILAGITPDSPYYNTDQNIDNYQKTM